MCGDLEEDKGEDDVHSRFVAHAHSVLSQMKRQPRNADPVHAHLDRMFRQLLSEAIDPNRAPDEMSGYQRIAMEPLVFARLAGFIAAHVPLGEDPLRRIMEAMMLGYSEGEIEAPSHDHDHDHDPFHSHGHGHGHSH